MSAEVIHRRPLGSRACSGYSVGMTLVFTKLGFDPDFMDYTKTWSYQEQLRSDVAAGRAPNTVLLLEHAPTYTAGKRTEPHERPLDGTPVVPVDRGGKLTWHGPGQLVVYPVLALADPHGVKEYVSTLEDILLAVLSRHGVTAQRVDGRAGLWVPASEDQPARKIAAIGIRIHDGVTMHGVALNCNNSLEPYEQIIACGISDAGTTSISAETGREVGVSDVVDDVIAEFSARERTLVGPAPAPVIPEAGAAVAEHSDPTQPEQTSPIHPATLGATA